MPYEFDPPGTDVGYEPAPPLPGDDLGWYPGPISGPEGMDPFGGGGGGGGGLGAGGAAGGPLGKLFGGKDAAKGLAALAALLFGRGGAGAGNLITPEMREIQRLQMQRIQQSQPLYELMLRYAHGLTPRWARSGMGVPGGAGAPSGMTRLEQRSANVDEAGNAVRRGGYGVNASLNPRIGAQREVAERLKR